MACSSGGSQGPMTNGEAGIVVGGGDSTSASPGAAIPPVEGGSVAPPNAGPDFTAIVKNTTTITVIGGDSTIAVVQAPPSVGVDNLQVSRPNSSLVSAANALQPGLSDGVAIEINHVVNGVVRRLDRKSVV